MVAEVNHICPVRRREHVARRDARGRLTPPPSHRCPCTYSFGHGTRTVIRCFAARSSAIARSREFAATPPPITSVPTLWVWHASIAFGQDLSKIRRSLHELGL